jgi:hypothetical protein
VIPALFLVISLASAAQAGAIGCYDDCNRFCGFTSQPGGCPAECKPGAPPLPPPAPSCAKDAEGDSAAYGAPALPTR